VTWKVLIVVASMACVGRSVAAQGFESAPAGAIFGVAKGGTRDRLDVTAALSEAYDREPPPDLRPRIQNGALPGGFSSMMTAAAEYERSRRRADVTGQVFTALQYYPSLGEVVVLTHNAGVGAKVALPARSSLELTQTVAAIVTLALCQAVDLRQNVGCNMRAVQMTAVVRERVPFNDRDRRQDLDIATLVEMINAGTLPIGAIDFAA